MTRNARHRPKTDPSPETKLFALRGTIVGSASQIVFTAALLAIHRTTPVWFAVALAGAAVAAAAALLLHFRAPIAATQQSPLDDRITGDFDLGRERRVRRALLVAYGLPLLFEVVVVVILIASRSHGGG